MRVKRLIAGYIDLVVIFFISCAPVCIVTLGKFDTTPLSVASFFASFFLLLMIKDFILKTSIGKRILKLEIVKIDGTRLTLLDALKRSLPFIFLLPIEVILMIINDRRLGDVWAGTVVRMI